MIENLQTIKAERDDYKRRFEELKIESEVSRIVDSLPAGYDHAKIRRLADDSLDVFQLDENENVVTRSGKPVKDWLLSRANLYKFKNNESANLKKTTPGDYISELAEQFQ